MLAGLRRWRRGNHRHAHETAHLGQWLDTVNTLLPTDYALAVEVLRCRRLIKGYSDTHSRGQGKYDLLLQAALTLQGRAGAAGQLAQWISLALREADIQQLQQALGGDAVSCR
jgi:indolepyruvate ferredoxin oxidoreductase beta subunit